MDGIYWDYNATAPLHPVVRERIRTALDSPWVNPSSLHSTGQQTRMALDQARKSIATALGADPSEIVFTATATEANFLALWGLYLARSKDQNRKKIVLSPFEHNSVFENARLLVERFEAELVFLPLTPSGLVDLREAERILSDPQVALCSVIAGHNETGVLQPWVSIGDLCRKLQVPFHSDLVQLVGKIPFSLSESPVDLATIAFYKAGGPKGIGVLYMKTGTNVEYILRGGGQERKRRSGSENLLSVLGAEAFCGFLKDLQNIYQTSVLKLRNEFEMRLHALAPTTEVVGAHCERLPNTSYVIFPNSRADAMVMALDLDNIRVGTGSACSSGMFVPSRALLNLSYSHEQAIQAVRFSLGPESSEDELKKVIASLSRIFSRRAA